MRSGFANSFQALTRFVLLFGFGLLVTAANPICAQDTLESLQAQWKELDAKLTEKEEALAAEDADTEKLQGEYESLIGDANKLVKKIEIAAKEKTKADPGNSAGTRALMGILLNEAQNGSDSKVLESGQELIEQGINPEYFKIAAKSERLSIGAREIFDELVIRQEEALKNDLPRVELKTNKGDIILELFENEAPETVGNFISVVESGHYDGVLFHRVMEDFMAQSGGFVADENGKEKRKPLDYTIECECDEPDYRLHFTGSLSMAHTGAPNTGSAQFFLTFRRTSRLDKLHTCFGRVIKGSKTLELIARTHDQNDQRMPDVKADKIISAKVLRKRDHRYRPNKVGVDEAALDAAEAKAKAEAEAAAKAKAEAEAKAAEEKRMAEEKKKAEEEAAKMKAEIEAKKKAEEEAAAKKAAEEEAAKKKAEAEEEASKGGEEEKKEGGN